jgi:hypothetical protein
MAVLMLLPKTAHATALFLAWTPKEIVVAADSIGVRNNGTAIADSICKIR